jgi:hypothetical protein
VRSVLLITALLGLVGCGAQVEATFETIPTPEATPEATTPSATAIAPSPTPELSTPGSVTVTFRLTLTGPVPSDATFALQDGELDGAQHAIYLCSSVYEGYPTCADGGTYDDVWIGPPGTQLTYRFWRELDVNGTEEAIEAGEVTVALTGQIVSVTYDFQP